MICGNVSIFVLERENCPSWKFKRIWNDEKLNKSTWNGIRMVEMGLERRGIAWNRFFQMCLFLNCVSNQWNFYNRSYCNENWQNKMKKTKSRLFLHLPRIEPGSADWESAMLTTAPQALWNYGWQNVYLKFKFIAFLIKKFKFCGATNCGHKIFSRFKLNAYLLLW